MGARIFTAVLALLVLVGAVYLLTTDPPWSLKGPDRVASLKRALENDPRSPRLWCDLGDALAEAEKASEAADCYRRAVELGPGSATILMRAVNFWVIRGESEPMLPVAKRLLGLVRDYDAPIFSYFDRLLDDPAAIAAELRGNAAAEASYIRTTAAARRRFDAAALVWKDLAGPDDKLAAQYTNGLVAAQRYEEARETWSRYLGARAGAYPLKNKIYNGGFDYEPTNCAFDWTIRAARGASAAREGSALKRALKITFEGTENVAYDHVRQTVYLEPGHYYFTARVKSDGITTNEGVYFRVTGNGVEAATPAITGTHDWGTVEAEFAVRTAGAVEVRVARRVSRKFDNKIAGTVWVDEVRLVARGL